MKILPTDQEIEHWIQRQESLDQPCQVYIAWLKKRLTLTCQADVIKRKDGEIKEPDYRG